VRTEPYQPQIAQERPRRSFLFLIVEESHQHAKHVCQEALIAQQEAQERVRMSQLARQRRQSEHVERALCREHWSVK
jgi:hypothetical protein